MKNTSSAQKNANAAGKQQQQDRGQRAPGEQTGALAKHERAHKKKHGKGRVTTTVDRPSKQQAKTKTGSGIPQGSALGSQQTNKFEDQPAVEMKENAAVVPEKIEKNQLLESEPMVKQTSGKKDMLRVTTEKDQDMVASPVQSSKPTGGMPFQQPYSSRQNDYDESADEDEDEIDDQVLNMVSSTSKLLPQTHQLREQLPLRRTADADGDSTSTAELKTHNLDPDAKGGTRELVILSVKVKERIIQVVTREDTDIMKLYDRIALIGNFQNFPKKFRKIFLVFWQNLIDEARALLDKQTGQSEQQNTAASSHVQESQTQDNQSVTNKTQAQESNSMLTSAPSFYPRKAGTQADMLPGSSMMTGQQPPVNNLLLQHYQQAMAPGAFQIPLDAAAAENDTNMALNQMDEDRSKAGGMQGQTTIKDPTMLALPVNFCQMLLQNPYHYQQSQQLQQQQRQHKDQQQQQPGYGQQHPAQVPTFNFNNLHHVAPHLFQQGANPRAGYPGAPPAYAQQLGGGPEMNAQPVQRIGSIGLNINNFNTIQVNQMPPAPPGQYPQPHWQQHQGQPPYMAPQMAPPFYPGGFHPQSDYGAPPQNAWQQIAHQAAQGYQGSRGGGQNHYENKHGGGGSQSNS